jgi:cytochrome c-type biogenesis protein CcmH/NrfG
MRNAVLVCCVSVLSGLPVAAQAPRDNPPPSIERARQERELRALIAGGAAMRENYLELAHLDTALQRYADAVSALGSAADLDPTSAERLHQIGTICWQYANRDVQDPAGRLLYLRKGIALEARALRIRPD